MAAHGGRWTSLPAQRLLTGGDRRRAVALPAADAEPAAGYATAGLRLSLRCRTLTAVPAQVRQRARAQALRGPHRRRATPWRERFHPIGETRERRVDRG